MSNARDKANIPSLNFSSTGIDDNATSTAITIDSSENVGIGTSSPQRNLHIHASQPYLQLTSSSTGTTSTDGFQLIVSGSEAVLMQRENSAMSFYTNGSEKMRITSSGNVGIGTTSPSAVLDVRDETNGANFIVGGSGTTNITKIGGGAGDNLQLFTNSTTPVMLLSTSGNVGIGTSSPQATTEIVGGTGDIKVLRLRTGDSTAGNNAGFDFNLTSSATQGNRSSVFTLDADGANATGSDYLQISKFGGSNQKIFFPSNDLIFEGSSEHVRITSDGKVGIGTTNPNRMLTVEGDGGEPDISLVNLDNTNNNFNQIRFLSVGSDDSTRRLGADIKALYTSHSTGNPTTDLVFGTASGSSASTERMRIDSSGNVGIGITNPSFPLDLSGNGLNNSTVSSSTQYGLRANLHLCFSPGSTTLGNMNDQRNIAVRNRYGTGTSNSPGGNGVVMAFQHYPNGTTGNGSSYITQMAFEHNSNPAGNIYFRNSDVSTGATFSNWYSIDLTNTSDIRSKENIIDAPEQITRLKNLNIKQFNYKNNTEGTNDLGLIAQEADEIIPEYVVKNNENPEAMWRILYNRMTPMLIKCIQEQQTKIEELEARITTLETNNP